MSFFDVVVVNHPRRGRSDLEAAVVLRAVHVRACGLTGMMIEPEAGARDEWEVRENVIRGDLDLPVLDVLRMNELDAFDGLHFFEKDGTGKPIEIGSRDEAHS